MHHPTERIAHTTAFVTPIVEHWLERENAQWVHHMKDRSDDPSHHERTPFPRSYNIYMYVCMYVCIYVYIYIYIDIYTVGHEINGNYCAKTKMRHEINASEGETICSCPHTFKFRTRRLTGKTSGNV